MFSQATIDNLGYYVYALLDPRNGEIFYVGKGTGNRVWQHGLDAENDPRESRKLVRLREIAEAGYVAESLIVRHDLKEEVAFELEAALIDVLGFRHLTNMQLGHRSDLVGLRSVAEVELMYAVQELKTELPVLLININRLYKRRMSKLELYEATRKAWKIGTRREKARYALAVYRGITRAVYEIDHWEPMDGGRWGFVGDVPDSDTVFDLIDKSVKDHFQRGAANPVKYLNC